MLTVLAILADGFEEIEAVAPIDLLRRAGAQVVVSALGDGIHVTGRNGLTMHADTNLTGVMAQTLDCLLHPGGPGVKLLRADPLVRMLVKRHHANNGWLAGICAAPTVLHDADLLEGRRYTAHFSAASELPHILSDERLVADGRILTSRGTGTSLDIALKLVEVLFSADKAKEIATSISL